MKENKLIAEFMQEGSRGFGLYDYSGKHYKLYELKFHTSWDWLMPVVEKIYSTDADVDFFKNLSIQATYKAVVEFIKEQKQLEIMEDNNSNKMKKFRVYVESTSDYYIDVQAKNQEEAKDIADNTDGGEFIENGLGSWDITSADEREEHLQTIIDNDQEMGLWDNTTKSVYDKKHDLVLKSIMTRYGGLTNLICQLREDSDVAYVNISVDTDMVVNHHEVEDIINQIIT